MYIYIHINITKEYLFFGMYICVFSISTENIHIQTPWLTISVPIYINMYTFYTTTTSIFHLR